MPDVSGNDRNMPAGEINRTRPATDAMVSDAPTACKFCGDTTRTFNSHRDGIKFECGAGVLWHDPPHGNGWSWWTQPSTCKRIVALRDDIAFLLTQLQYKDGYRDDDRITALRHREDVW